MPEFTQIGLPDQWLIFFTAMLPVTELRAAIPFAIQILKMNPIEAFLLATAGNILVTFIILWLLEPISHFLMKKFEFFNKILTKLFEKTRTKHSQKFYKYGAVFLILFVAIPLPGSGAWSGSLIAFLFGVTYWHAVVLISTGVIIAGILITAGFESIVKIIEFFM